MRDGLRFSVALNEFVVAAVCFTIAVCTVGYLYTHTPHAAPAQEACVVKEPTITIEQTFFIPVPAPKVNVKIQLPKPLPHVTTPDTNVQPEQEPDPVFEHRTPIITSALQQPMPR
jgi:hypothetical protein